MLGDGKVELAQYTVVRQLASVLHDAPEPGTVATLPEEDAPDRRRSYREDPRVCRLPGRIGQDLVIGRIRVDALES